MLGIHIDLVLVTLLRVVAGSSLSDGRVKNMPESCREGLPQGESFVPCHIALSPGPHLVPEHTQSLSHIISERSGE